MIRRLKLSTKLRLLIVIALAATLAVGIPSLIAARRSWTRAANAPVLARAAADAGDLLGRVEHEATESAGFLASGAPGARAALRTSRPLTDRAARVLERDQAALSAAGHPAAARALAAVGQAWSVLRDRRINTDRRTVTDAAALRQFDTMESEILRALDATSVAATGPLAADLRAKSAVARVEVSIAQEQSALLIALERNNLTAAIAQRLGLGAAAQQIARPAAIDTARHRSARLGLVAAEVDASASAVARLRAPALARRLPSISTSEWRRVSDRQLVALRTVGSTLDTTAGDHAASAARGARDAFLRRAGLLAGLLVATIAAGLIVIRAITRPIRDVTKAATALAHRHRDPLEPGHDPAPKVQPISVRTRDEIGEVARAIHDIDLATTGSVEAQRQTLRHDIGDVYVNLARRNQPLLHHQLEIIDRLEASERDPDRLSSLFLLDHLATRLRRNAESLLVLAGVDDQRTHVESAPLLDVVRAAASEIADFARVDIVGLPTDVEIVGRFAIDLTHVLAELLENATAYSPPDTRIFVGARRRADGLELTIADEGIGIPVDRLDALNELLAHPPLPGFDLSRSLGLVVVARLCERIGVEVQLRSASEIGTSAMIALPLAMMRSPDHDPALITKPDEWVGSELAPPDVDQPDIIEPDVIEPEQLPGPVTTPVTLELQTPVEPAPETELPPPISPPDEAPEGTPIERPVEVPIEVSVEVSVEAAPRTVDRFNRVPLAGSQDLLPAAGRRPRPHRRRNGKGVPTPSKPPETASDRVDAESPAVVTLDAAPLPRRRPVTAEATRATTAPAPAARPPSAVFELVARYEAGRRRALPEDDAQGPT